MCVILQSVLLAKLSDLPVIFLNAEEKIAKQRSRKLVYQFDKEGERLENYTKY